MRCPTGPRARGRKRRHAWRAEMGGRAARKAGPGRGTPARRDREERCAREGTGRAASGRRAAAPQASGRARHTSRGTWGRRGRLGADARVGSEARLRSTAAQPPASRMLGAGSGGDSPECLRRSVKRRRGSNTNESWRTSHRGLTMARGARGVPLEARGVEPGRPEAPRPKGRPRRPIPSTLGRHLGRPGWSTRSASQGLGAGGARGPKSKYATRTGCLPCSYPTSKYDKYKARARRARLRPRQADPHAGLGRAPEEWPPAFQQE
jgi:hypothetical protein